MGRLSQMSERITSLQNGRVKDAVKLRDRRGRQKQGRTIIDGVREILRAIDAGVEIVELFVCREQGETEERRRAVQLARQAGAKLWDVSPRVCQKMSFGDRAEGLVAVAALPRPQLSQWSLDPAPLIAVLADIEKPGNLGAIIRSADGAGVAGVVVTGGGTDLYNPNVIRASLGTVFSMPVCCAGCDEVRSWLRQRNIQLVTAEVQGTVPYDQFDFTRPTAIVLGNESAGLSSDWPEEAAARLRLPMQGAADSLNVSAAAAVLFYEALRQRRTAETRAAPHSVSSTPRT